MINEKSLVIYKNRPAIVTGHEGDKLTISCLSGGSGADIKVREKDIALIHPGPCSAKELTAPGNGTEAAQEAALEAALEAWELLEADNAGSISFKEMTELIFGEYSPRAAWTAWELLREGLYFTGDAAKVNVRPRAIVEEDEKKRQEKQKEAGDRAAFLAKLKKLPPFTENAGLSLYTLSSQVAGLSEQDRRFLLDVEALARGQSDKSRTLKELGRSETPEEAHRLLLTAGIWTVLENPHPDRFNASRESAKIIPPPPPDEERLDLTHLAAFAIDNSWSDDPDDAVSLEEAGDGACRLWVHVADPAASVCPGSPADEEARGRGATLYLPEGPSRMLAPEALPLFALGVAHNAAAGAGREADADGISPALSFRLDLKPDCSLGDVEIFPSIIKVTRLSYAEADAVLANNDGGITCDGKPRNAWEILSSLDALAGRSMERRLNTGAVIIDLPDAHISVSLIGPEGSKIAITPIGTYRSADMIRECMILAGEGAALWALQRQIPFPYISQEAGELPERRLPGLAGAFQLRRCMRPRVISVKPGVHWGLGLDEYTQVTSPLRRYTDLLCHEQIRAFLKGEKPLSGEEILLRISASDAAASAVTRAEKASRAHWMAVYLLQYCGRQSGHQDMENTAWEAVILDRKGNRGTALIPALGLETQIGLHGKEEPNDIVQLCVSSVKLPEAEANFSLCG